jgi:hypothetical protein
METQFRVLRYWNDHWKTNALTISFYSQWYQDINQKKRPHPKEEDECCEEPAKKKARVTTKNIDELRNALHDVQGYGTDVSTSKTVFEDIKDIQSHTPASAPSRSEAMMTLKALLYSLSLFLHLLLILIPL